jgi:hypothetical protein
MNAAPSPLRKSTLLLAINPFCFDILNERIIADAVIENFRGKLAGFRSSGCITANSETTIE